MIIYENLNNNKLRSIYTNINILDVNVLPCVGFTFRRDKIKDITINHWDLGPGGLKSLIEYITNPKIFWRFDVDWNGLGLEGAEIVFTYLLAYFKCLVQLNCGNK